MPNPAAGQRSSSVLLREATLYQVRAGNLQKHAIRTKLSVRQSKKFTQNELLELLTNVREKNARLGVTGLLLYDDGNFMQVLEGAKETVKALYDTITKDRRHQGYVVIDEDELPARQFSDWSMGFSNLIDPEVKAMPGFSEIMDRHLRAEEFRSDPTGCLKLLSFFRKTGGQSV